MGTAIPEGYELLANRSRANARLALKTAEEREIDPQRVLTIQDGYLIPLVEGHEPLTPVDDEETEEAEVVEIETPKVSWSKGDTVAFAEEYNIDLGDASNQEERVAAINAEIERRTSEAEKSGVLTDGSENKGE